MASQATTPPLPVIGYNGITYGNPANTGSGLSQSYVGSYPNLPSGISNAGGGSSGSAYTGEVQDNGLVQDRLQGLLTSNSPYMQQAAQQGANFANSRGLLNSSIAAGNSQQAALQAALPIATTDAGAINNQQLANQAMLNQVLQTRMNNNTSRGNTAMQTAAQRYATNMGFRNNQNQRDFEGSQAGLNRDWANYMSGQDYQHQLGMAAFGTGAQLLLGSQNFQNSAGLQAMQNPFLLQNPQALGSYFNFINGGANSSINDLFGYAFSGYGGGQ